MRRILFTVLCLNFVFINHVAANCKINGIELKDRTIFYSYPANGAVRLLMTNSVPIGTRLILACADSAYTLTVDCSSSTPLISIVNEQCPGPLRAVLKIAANYERMPTCNSPNIDYKVGYDYGNSFYELYRVCFDSSEKRTLFTKNFIEGFSDEYKSPRPEAAFTTDGIYMQDENEKLSPVSVCATFQDLLSGQSPISQSTKRNRLGHIVQPCVIARGHLTSQNDFFQYCNKKATFKLINMVPQFQQINSKNWLRIENWSHRAYSGQSTIITGALGVLELLNAQKALTRMYILPQYKMPIPTWMYKIVANRGQCIIFVTYNNIYYIAPALPCTARCPSDLNLTPGVTAGQTVCCTNQEFQGLTNINHGIC